MNTDKIVKVGESITHWPSRTPSHKKVTFANKDGVEYAAEVPIKECALLVYLDELGMANYERELLKKMIREYGHEKYYEGEMDESMSDADESL